MAVTVRIPSYLAEFAKGQTALTLDTTSRNVRDLLADLWRQYPALRDRVVDEQSEVRQHINIFVGEDAIRHADGLDTPVSQNDEIMIVPAVSGG
ncbi:MAG TPA: ubiquitin-like small modifier protein 1 [Candidatus Angelobacter sp.]|nr:ubiquitin-like small modifier protein 1 [Candidatus Angelobacter sp.]